MAAADGLVDAAAATRNPLVMSYALLTYGNTFGDADPASALEALRRGVVIARDSGNRATETHLAGGLSRLEAKYGDPLAAFEYFSMVIRSYLDSGNPTIRVTMTTLAACFDRLGRHNRRFRTCEPFRRSGDPREPHRDHPPP